jgi:8-oxo-dGTP pyrophosphatase MutT (NUDIX family)
MEIKSPKICDHTSVGVVLEDKQGNVLLLKRALFPVGMAPPAGHIDDHGSPEQAAIDEVEEEVGLVVAIQNLHKTAIQKRRTNLSCRRIDGDHHDWWVYTTDTYDGELRPSPDETKGANWYGRDELQAFADRTRAFQAGSITDEDYQANPGFDEVWLDFLVELGYVE